MALRKTLVFNADTVLITPYGRINSETKEISLSDIYIRIASVRGNKDLLTIEVEFDFPDNPLLKTYAFTPSVADGSENFIRQGYEYLKTLPEFAEAVDC